MSTEHIHPHMPLSTDMMHSITPMHRGALTADIRARCHETAAPGEENGRLWYDTRPMLDPREQPSHALDMALIALQMGEEMGVIHRHPLHPHLVRIL